MISSGVAQMTTIAIIDNISGIGSETTARTGTGGEDVLMRLASVGYTHIATVDQEVGVLGIVRQRKGEDIFQRMMNVLERTILVGAIEKH